MDKDKIERLIEVHKDKTTKELKSIVLKRNVEEWDIETLEAMEQILESRDVHLEFDLSEEPPKPPPKFPFDYRPSWWLMLPIIIIIYFGLTAVDFPPSSEDNIWGRVLRTARYLVASICGILLACAITNRTAADVDGEED